MGNLTAASKKPDIKSKQECNCGCSPAGDHALPTPKPKNRNSMENLTIPNQYLLPASPLSSSESDYLSDSPNPYGDDQDFKNKFTNRNNNYQNPTKYPSTTAFDFKPVISNINKFDKDKLKPTKTIVRHTVAIIPKSNVNAGADSSIKNENELKEFYDTKEEIIQKAKEFVQLINQSKHIVIYTGAGISTTAKLPDYRGPNGVWTLIEKEYKPQFNLTCEQAIPTYSHMAIKKLLDLNKISYVISTNVDGLHRQSGIPKNKISELHGNIYIEKCIKCDQEYLRPFNVTKTHNKLRYTGRLCENYKCNGNLHDSIINFGENLAENELNNATKHSLLADLVIVLGNSMRVSPACELPMLSINNKNINSKLIIVNLQHTPYDKYCKLSNGFRIGAKIDQFMKIVMKQLNINVETFKESEFIKIAREQVSSIVKDPNFAREA